MKKQKMKPKPGSGLRFVRFFAAKVDGRLHIKSRKLHELFYRLLVRYSVREESEILGLIATS